MRTLGTAKAPRSRDRATTRQVSQSGATLGETETIVWGEMSLSLRSAIRSFSITKMLQLGGFILIIIIIIFFSGQRADV